MGACADFFVRFEAHPIHERCIEAECVVVRIGRGGERERAKKKKNARCQVKRTMLHNIGIVLWPGESLYSNWPRLHTRETDLNAYTECKNGKVGSSYCTQRAPNHLTQKNVSDLNVCDAVFRSLCSSLFFFFFSPTMDKTPEHQRKLNALKLKAYAFRQMPKYALRIIK